MSLGVPIPLTPRPPPGVDHPPFADPEQDGGDGGLQKEPHIPTAQPDDDEQHRQEGDRFTSHVEDGPQDFLWAPGGLIADALDALLELLILIAGDVEHRGMRQDPARNAEAQEVVELRVDEAAGALARRAPGQQEHFQQEVAERRLPHPMVAAAVASAQGVEEQLADIGLGRGNARAEPLQEPTTGDEPPILMPGQAEHRPDVVRETLERCEARYHDPHATLDGLHRSVQNGSYGPLCS